MARRYSTIQRRHILEFLSESGGRHLTAEEVFLALREKGHEVGRATVYRYLDKLTEDGVLRKYPRLDGSGAAYEYCGCGEGHPHLKCDSCGELTHLECPGLPLFFQHVVEDHEFEIDPARAVFHGTCGKCKDREEETPGEKEDCLDMDNSVNRGGGFSLREQ